jgi:hypothetical protein
MAGRHNFASTVLAGVFDEASLSLRGPSGTQGFRAAIQPRRFKGGIAMRQSSQNWSAAPPKIRETSAFSAKFWRPLVTPRFL